MTASEAEVGVIEVDAGDAPAFTVDVAPFALDTSMTATVTDPAGVSAPFTMTPNTERSQWTGSTAALPAAGEYTVTFTTIGTGAGVKYATVIVAVPPPLSSNVRLVRLLIADDDPANRLFRIDQLQDFLTMEGGVVKLAAATALEVIARSEVLISKVIKTQDLSTDGAKVAAELRASAASLRKEVADAIAVEDDTAGGFDIVDFADPFSRYTAELAE